MRNEVGMVDGCGGGMNPVGGRGRSRGTECFPPPPLPIQVYKHPSVRRQFLLEAFDTNFTNLHEWRQNVLSGLAGFRCKRTNVRTDPQDVGTAVFGVPYFLERIQANRSERKR